jgi:hypothetical protein
VPRPSANDAPAASLEPARTAPPVRAAEARWRHQLLLRPAGLFVAFYVVTRSRIPRLCWSNFFSNQVRFPAAPPRKCWPRLTALASILMRQHLLNIWRRFAVAKLGDRSTRCATTHYGYAAVRWACRCGHGRPSRVTAGRVQSVGGARPLRKVAVRQSFHAGRI